MHRQRFHEADVNIRAFRDRCKCYNCGAQCLRGEYELEYWRGRENGYESETVCLDCHTTHAFGDYLSLEI